MRRSSWAKLGVAVGVVCALGIGWALAAPRVQDMQQAQPALEIPLYEGAQVEWEVHLTEQEMAKSLAEWAQALSVLKISGYTIAGERALEVLNFYDQALSGWRRILWTQPTEAGGVRLFARSMLSIVLSKVRAVLQQDPLLKRKDVQVGSFQVIGTGKVNLFEKENYLFIAVSKRYAATDLIVATAQVISKLDVPIFEGAELQWEVVLTKRDLLGYLARWFERLGESPPLAMRWQPERSQDSLVRLGWLGILGVEMLSQLLQDFSELRVVGSRVDLVLASQVLDFYEQQFGGWQRNLWINAAEFGSIRIFTRSDDQELQELVAFIVMPGYAMRVGEVHTKVIVLRARR